MEILVICPASCATGGTEALHLLASELNKLDGVHAMIWYWDIRGGDPNPPEFASYNCEFVTKMPDGFDGVVISPEIWANDVTEYTNCIRVIYWLGVDAYAGWTQPAARGDFLKDKEILHIAQSEYAYDFLKTLGVKNIMKLTDVLNADFYADYKETERSNVVLYNPAKATPFMTTLIKECNGIQFKPIQNMTRQQVIEAMRGSKLYIDFGEFPGRERIPREAVLCGCCIITSKIGSAGYYYDFQHDYKFESKPGHIWAIRWKMDQVLEHYDKCRKDFDFFRVCLKEDTNIFKTQVKKLAGKLNEIQHNRAGV